MPASLQDILFSMTQHKLDGRWSDLLLCTKTDAMLACQHHFEPRLSHNGRLTHVGLAIHRSALSEAYQGTKIYPLLIQCEVGITHRH